MTKSRNTKRALLLSILSMMLCAAMLAGSTFAWFTDTATSGKNRIVAGNLDIELQGKIDGEYQDLSDGSLFNSDIKWEPGKVEYRELKLQNLGTLAAKYSFNISNDIEFNFVLEPNDDGGYIGTARALYEVLRFAVYEGTFEQLTDAVNEEAETTYQSTDREVVKKALELGLISGDLLMNTDPLEGAIIAGMLSAKEEKELTFIAYWAFEEDDIEFWEIVDDNYNLKNGLMASISTDENEVYDFENEIGRILPATAASDDGLYIDFDIVVYATQASSESDSFGNDYDAGAKYKDVYYPEDNPSGPELG